MDSSAELEAVNKELSLFKGLLAQHASVEADGFVEEKDPKKRRTEQEGSPGTGSGTNPGQTRSHGSRFSDKQIQDIVVTLARLSIRHEDSLNTLRMDTGFMLFMLPEPGMVSVMLPVADRWKTLRTQTPSAISSPLRFLMLKIVVEELQTRVKRLFTDEQASKQVIAAAQKEGVLDAEMRFTYRRWDGDTKSMIVMEKAPFDQRPGSCGPQSLRSHLATLFSPQVSLYQTFDKDYECEDGAVHVGTQSQVQWCSRSVGGVRQTLNECSDEPHRSQYEAHESSTISIGDLSEEVPRQDGQDRQVSTTTSPAKMSSMLSMNVPQPSHLRNSEQQIRMRWLQMLVENTSAVCYLNSGIQVLGWGILTQTDALDTWEIIGELMLELLSLTSPCSIHTTETCRNLLQSWPDIHRQHDVAELIGYSLTRLELRKEDLGQWGVIYPEAGWIEYTFPLVQPLPLPLPEDAQAVSLQMLFDTWTIEGSKRLGILSPLHGFFLVQLGRFIVTASGIHKTIRQIDGLEAPVRVPVFSVLEGMQLTRYAICGVVVHHGATPDSGHYTCLLREGTQWWLKDDSRAPVLLPALSIEHCRGCYVLCLSRIQDGS